MKPITLLMIFAIVLFSCNSNTHNNVDEQGTKTYFIDDIQAGKNSPQQVTGYQITVSTSTSGTTMFVITTDLKHPIVFPVNIYMKVDSMDNENIYSFNYMDNLTYRFHVKQ